MPLSTGVKSIAKSGSSGIRGNVTLSQGTNITLTQSGQDISIAATAGGGTTCLTIVPKPSGMPAKPSNIEFYVQRQLNVNTQQFLGQVVIPFAITANKISISIHTAAVAGTFDLSLYSEDGQTRLFSVTTATISGAGVVTTALSAVSIPAGIYYIGINTNSTADITVYTYNTSKVDADSTGVKGLSALSTEPTMDGYVTITAGTPATTFTPSSNTYTEDSIPLFRLDN